MIIYWLTLLINLLFVITNADINKAENLAIAVAEHKPNDIIPSDSFDPSWKATSEKTLIRVTRANAYFEKLIANNRQRRQTIDPEEIWGMAKKVAITVFVLVSLCIICCIITTIVVCVKCCCGRNNGKRNQGFNTIPQPIIIHTSSPNYQQQQGSSPSAQIWHPENHPMLPQPSAPPQPNDDFHMERPPPYEKICGS